MEKKLNVGCGPNHIRPGWINMDLRPFKGVDAARDATLPFDDLGPFSHIYSEHFLEHLPLKGAIKFFKNCLCALHVGGRMRLSTPSIEFVTMTHFDPFEADEKKVIDNTMAMNRAFHGWGHQFLWSKPMLMYSMKSLGFEEVEFHAGGESNDPVFVDIEKHGHFRYLKGIPNFLVVEGVRGLNSEVSNGEFEKLAQDMFIRYVEGGH
jgi:hypothetical protein